MSDFYINVIQHGNQLLIREVDKGKRVSRRLKWQPKLYVPSPIGSEWKTLGGQPLDSVSFKTIKDARNFIQMHQDNPESCLWFGQLSICLYRRRISRLCKLEYG